MMEMGEWKEITIQEIKGSSPNALATGPFGSSIGSIHFMENGVPLIRGGNLSSETSSRLKEDSFVFVSKEKAEEFKRSIAKSGDLIFTCWGTINQIGLIDNRSLYREYLISNKQMKLTPNPLIADSEFLYYLFSSPQVQGEILGNNIGSSVPGFNLGQLKSMKILLPPLPEQTAIASILSSLDDKIDLLHRQNDTMEKIAETLFRQWFVEEAKEEWEDGTLDDILSVKGGTTPSTSEPNYWNGTIHWTSPRDITNLNGIYLFDTERKITELGLFKISSGLLPEGTLLMSSRAPVGVLAFSIVPVAINQGYIGILDNKGYSKEFIYLWLKINIDIIHSFSNGSTFMEISKSAFKTIQIQIPPKKISDDFQVIIKPLFDKIKSNQIQIRTLTALRDTLLPKLMSKEVRV